MSRSRTAHRKDRLSLLAGVLCILAAIPVLACHEAGHSPGARNAFQMLSFKPGKENAIAIRTLVAVITIPLAAA